MKVIFDTQEELEQFVAALKGAGIGVVTCEVLEYHHEKKATLDMRLSKLEWSVRSFIVLNHAGLQFVGQLVQQAECELHRINNCGPKVIREIKAILTNLGLELGTQFPGWHPPAE